MIFGCPLVIATDFSDLNDALELIESLDELPERKNQSSLLEEIALMLFIRPLQTLNLKQVPVALAKSLE